MDRASDLDGSFANPWTKLISSFDTLLSNLRPNRACTVPSYALDRTAVPVRLPVMDARLPKLDRPLRLAVDLDDTIVHNSCTCPTLWDLGGYQGRDILDGYAYAKMRTSWRGYGQRLLGRARHDTIDRTRHPYLGNPRVIIAPNLAMLSLLATLKARGATLALATASARMRVAYLFDRLPILKSLFGAAVFCAEDIAERAAKAAAHLRAPHPDNADLGWAGQSWALSAPAHAARPYSLMAKTPWALAPCFDGAAYDFLIDDSQTTAALFHGNGLGPRLISISGQSFGPRAWESVTTCLKRLFDDNSFALPEERTDMLRIEDPLYWPLLHARDQLDPEALNG